jgi:hypothetical protein
MTSRCRNGGERGKPIKKPGGIKSSLPALRSKKLCNHLLGPENPKRRELNIGTDSAD